MPPLTRPTSAPPCSGSPQAQILADHLVAVVRSDMIRNTEQMLSLIAERVEGFQKQVMSNIELEFTELRTENEYLRSELASTRTYSNKQETGGTGDTAPPRVTERSHFRSEDEEDVFFDHCGPIQSSTALDPSIAAEHLDTLSAPEIANGLPNSLVDLADGRPNSASDEGLNSTGAGMANISSNPWKSDLRIAGCADISATVMQKGSQEKPRNPAVQLPPSLPEDPEPPTDGPPLLKPERKTQQARFLKTQSSKMLANGRERGMKHMRTDRSKISPTVNTDFKEEPDCTSSFLAKSSGSSADVEKSTHSGLFFTSNPTTKSERWGPSPSKVGAAKIFGGFRGAANSTPKREDASEDPGSEKNGPHGNSGPRRTSLVHREALPVFADAAAMKDRVREVITKHDYNVADFYWEEGMAQFIARSQYFEWTTLSVIAFNALWIAIDLDNNDKELLLDSAMVFQIAEHSFCIYFTSEWLVRFLSFKMKRDCLTDGWFCFDSCLVIMMILETWVMNFVLLATSTTSSSGLGNTSVLKLVRLVRLTRMARMAKLLHAVPELIILIKGIAVAARTVFFTLLLLAIIIYFFAIVFRSLTLDSPIGDQYFPSVTASMSTLLLDGVMPDQSNLVRENDSSHPLLGALAVLFILLATLTVMNMLVGVLCEVVSVVSAVEKEQLTVNYVKHRLLKMFEGGKLDTDGNSSISRREFEDLLVNEEAASIIQDMGVDVVGLVDFADIIFEDDIELTFSDFMELVLQLRGTNTCTVKDIVDLRKFVVTEFNSLQAKFCEIIEELSDRDQLRSPNRCKPSHTTSSSTLTRGGSRSAGFAWLQECRQRPSR